MQNPIKMKVTRRQKKEAVELLLSRVVSDSVVFKLLGHIQADAKWESNGGDCRTVAKSLAIFVKNNSSEIRSLPSLV